MMLNVSRPAAGMHVLDVGGTGTIFSYHLAVLGCQVHTIDIDEKKIQAAAQFAQQVPAFSLMDNRLMSMLDMSAYPEGAFDRVFSICVVEHLPSHEAQAQAMREMVRVLRPGGIVGLTYDVWSPATHGILHQAVAGEIGAFESPEQVQQVLVDAVAGQAAVFGNTPVLWGSVDPRDRAPDDFWGSIGTLFLVKNS